MNKIARHNKLGFIGILNSDTSVNIKNDIYYGVYWFTNMYHKNLFTNLKCKIPPFFTSYFTKESDIIKIYKNGKLPRKLKKKLKIYLNK